MEPRVLKVMGVKCIAASSSHYDTDSSAHGPDAVGASVLKRLRGVLSRGSERSE